MLGFIGGFLLGSGLGANDAGNVFGTAVGSRMLSFRAASILAAVFVVLGATLQGAKGIETLRGLATQTTDTAVVTIFAAALTILLLTLLKLPVSTSQAVVGAIVGVGLIESDVDVSGLTKVFVCWVTTPVGALLCYVLLDTLLRGLFRRYRLSIFAADPVLRMGLVVCGCYGAYALGANNVANVAAVLVQGGFGPGDAALFGGISIAAGVLTFSKPVMMTVGQGIVRMDGFSALIAVLAHAVTVHVYALIGVPVSSSQAIIGAVLGIGLVKGLQVLRLNVLRNVLMGWLGTPVISAVLATLMLVLRKLN